MLLLCKIFKTLIGKTNVCDSNNVEITYFKVKYCIMKHINLAMKWSKLNAKAEVNLVKFHFGNKTAAKSSKEIALPMALNRGKGPMGCMLSSKEEMH